MKKQKKYLKFKLLSFLYILFGSIKLVRFLKDDFISPVSIIPSLIFSIGIYIIFLISKLITRDYRRRSNISNLDTLKKIKYSFYSLSLLTYLSHILILGELTILTVNEKTIFLLLISFIFLSAGTVISILLNEFYIPLTKKEIKR